MASPSKLISSRHEDVWAVIFPRFPIETLCRIRCVCKSWNSLVASSEFIAHHFSLANNKSHLLSNIYDTNAWFYSFLNDIPPRVPLPQPHLLRVPFQPTDNPRNRLFPSDRVFDVIGVVNGVVCLSHYSKRLTLLWNPAIHKYVEVPPSIRPSSPSLDGRVAHDVGFGFDACKNDFKVVRFWPPSVPHLPAFEVFSPQEGSWRKVAFDDRIGLCSFDSDRGCFKDGSIHWIVQRDYVMELLVFDCELDEFKTMELPREFDPSWRGWMEVFVTQRGELSVLGHRGENIVMWMMEEYGVESSWKESTAPYEEDEFVWMRAKCVGTHSPKMLKPMLIRGWKNVAEALHVFEPSMFLMEAKRHASSYNTKYDDKDGKVYFVKDGRRYDDCLPVWEGISFDPIALRSSSPS